MQIQYPKAILFDWDDTLVDSQSIINIALERTLKHFGCEDVDKDEIKKMSALSARDYFYKIFDKNTEEATQFYRMQYLELSEKKELRGLQGAFETLELINNLAQEKPFLGIVSNKRGELLREEVKRLSWQGYFNSIVGSGDASEDKPSSAPLKLALKDTNLMPESDHIWFIGDSHIDMQAAYKFKCYSILIGHNYDKELLYPYFPNFHVKNHFELQEIIKKLVD